MFVVILVPLAVIFATLPRPLSGTQARASLAKSPPPALFADLKHIDRLLTKLLRDWEGGKIGGDVVSGAHGQFINRAQAIKSAKATMVKDFFDGSTYGSVTFSEVFSQLDCLDSELFLALGYDLASSESRKHVPDFLKRGRKCKQKLETDLNNAAAQATLTATAVTATPVTPTATLPPPPQPILKPIHAVFDQSTYSTTYTENATGEGLTYQWAVAIPADLPCANEFQPNKPQPNQAYWFHADVSVGGPCNHTGGAYDAHGRGHPGTVVVRVTDAYWSCAATYYGTQGDNGNPVGDGPPQQPCQPKP
jgi:hypothetical protein